ncbi:helix-turn-helix transcriptional regulator [Dechloromonas denitrificans]|uniref:helix-turn-helix transcriptional regulator n=1 Tax=Dechloromonas denitrificans TaxID=281362 RepID=UPI001CFABD26|nr:AlpA family phage regulatory protein [Dechloromonas denitrificans]UCV09137.1 AlpA family phage regulatory protein [Dechloromonas denitrificans]
MKDKQPDRKIILDLHAVATVLSLSVSTVQSLVRDRASGFPESRQLSARRVGWLYREIEEWAENRPISTLLPPPNTGAKKPRTKVSDK